MKLISKQDVLYTTNAVVPPNAKRPNLEPKPVYSGNDDDDDDNFDFNLIEEDEKHDESEQPMDWTNFCHMHRSPNITVGGRPETANKEFLSDGVVIEGIVAVTRSPCLHPGDIVLCEAVNILYEILLRAISNKFSLILGG